MGTKLVSQPTHLSRGILLNPFSFTLKSPLLCLPQPSFSPSNPLSFTPFFAASGALLPPQPSFYFPQSHLPQSPLSYRDFSRCVPPSHSPSTTISISNVLRFTFLQSSLSSHVFDVIPLYPSIPKPFSFFHWPVSPTFSKHHNFHKTTIFSSSHWSSQKCLPVGFFCSLVCLSPAQDQPLYIPHLRAFPHRSHPHHPLH